MPKPLILVIEDETAIRDMLRFALETAGYQLIEATNTQEADQHLMHQQPQLILLDWMLPGCSGIQYIKQLRNNAKTRSIPIIMLTAKAEEHNKISGLEVGADDYVTKPFSPKELIARIKTVMRRGVLVSPHHEIVMDDLVINVDSKTVTIKNQLLQLTPNEYRLLHFLMTHANRVYSRQQLLDNVWPHQMEITERTVDVQIRRLRNRLKLYNHHLLIQTVRGNGYQFCRDKI